MVPVFAMVWPIVPLLIVAEIEIVTESFAGTIPFQVTVFVLVVAVPLDAKAETRVRPAGNTSENSFPGLSC